MSAEGRVLGCDACRELMQEEIDRDRLEAERLALSNAAATKLVDKRKSKSLVDSRKSVIHKKKLLPGGRIEGEPEWWGAGVSRVISVGPGIKFIEEVEDDICERTYSARKTKALEDRSLWIDFLKLMEKKYSEAMSSSLGPEWFQDLSPRQMGLLDKFHEILEADIQEGITSRTRRALKEIGVHPPLPTCEVSRCMKECSNNIIRFLFLLHKVLVDREQGPFDEEFREAAKEGRAILSYSINERLLLSGVFHLHFDEFTSKLDKLLPPPPVKPKLILPKKPPPAPKKKYKSPYLEPLPLPEKVWYEQKMEDELYEEQAKLVALQEKREFEAKVLKEAEEQKKAKEEKLRRLLEQKTYFGTSKSLKRTLESSNPQDISLLARENKSQIFKRVAGENSNAIQRSSSVNSRISSKVSFEASKSLQHVRKNRRYMYDVVHENVQTRTSFGGFFDNDNKLIKDSEGANLKIRLVPRNEKVVCLYKDDEFKPVQILDTRVRICCRDIGIQTEAEPMFLPINVNPEAEFYKLMEKITSVSMTEACTNTSDGREEDEEDEEVSKIKMVKSTKPITSPVAPVVEAKPINVECTDEKCALVEGSVPIDEYVMMRKKIEIYPPEKQLKASVAFLCRRGDPLAILPKIEETPWLQRWFELRRGIKEKLTPEEKEDLLQISKKLWIAKYKNVSTIIAQPFKIRRKVTTLERDWLMIKINAHKLDFQTRLRQQLVNNARQYFPTCFIEYFPTPLNKSLRKTFFTYLSSKELDAQVFKVWNMECKNMTKKIENVGENDNKSNGS